MSAPEKWTRRADCLRRWYIVVLIVTTLAYYWWSSTPAQQSYDALTEAFAHGRISLSSPTTDADVSLYKGKYYIYFGPAPVVTLLLPWRLLTGHHLPQEVPPFVFGSAAFVAAAGIFVRGLRLFPHPPARLDQALWLFALAGCANMSCFLRNGAIYETAIASAAFWLLVCAHAILRDEILRRQTLREDSARDATSRPDRPVAWLAVAGAAAALAVASRFSYILAAAWLLPIAYFRAWRSHTPLRRLAAAALPGAVLFTALLAYNQARFDNPLDSGIRYQQHHIWQAPGVSVGLRNVVQNVYLLFCQVTMPVPYFPFFDEHNTYYFFHYAWHSPDLQPHFNILLMTPVVCLAGFGVAALGRPGPLRFFAYLLLGPALLQFALLLCLPALAIRYWLDVVPCLLLFTALAYATLPARPWRRPLAATLIAVSGVVCAGMGIGGHDNAYKRLHPGEFARLERLFDFVPSLLVDLREYGPARLTVRLPQATKDYEPLVFTGRRGWAPNVLAVSVRDGQATFLSSTGIRSSAIRVDTARDHTIDVDMGSLYPSYMVGSYIWQHLLYRFVFWPEPGYLSRRGFDGARRERLLVELDGVPVLEARTSFHPPHGPAVFGKFLGRPPLEVASRFSGRILRVERLPFLTAP